MAVESTVTAAALLLTTSTPYPSKTPLPSPAEKPGPAPTPIPLKAPAEDAAGKIYSSTVDEPGAKADLSYLEVDGTGQVVKNSPLFAEAIPEGNIFASPDGTRLAIMGAWWAGNLFDISTGKLEPFYGRLGSVLFFNWFPDNQRIIFCDELGNLLLADPVSGKYTRLGTFENGTKDGAAVSPDGLKVVYSTRTDNPSAMAVWMVDSDGRNAHMLFSGSGTNFAWSPDGKHIVFLGDG